MEFLTVLVCLVVNALSVYVLTIAMYGNLDCFLEAWREWLKSILSLEIISGGAFPPLRLAYWLLFAAVIVWGEYDLIRRFLP
jgi:hypothetical protein